MAVWIKSDCASRDIMSVSGSQYITVITNIRWSADYTTGYYFLVAVPIVCFFIREICTIIAVAMPAD